MRWTRSSISDRARWRFKWFPQLFLVPRNKQQCGGALIAKREEWIGAPSQVRTPEERACGIGLDYCSKTSCTAPFVEQPIWHVKQHADAGPHTAALLQINSHPFLQRSPCQPESVTSATKDLLGRLGKRKKIAAVVDISWRGFGANLRLLFGSRTSSAFGRPFWLC